jgi:hypothetical protein
MFPPGRAKLATSPDPTGSPVCETIGIVVVARWAARVVGVPCVRRMSHIETHEFRHEVGKSVRITLPEAVLHEDTLPFDVAKLAEAPPEASHFARVTA